MINNYNRIAPLLNFSDPDDFYSLMILKRKKDQPEGERDNHQSVRMLKTYCVTSLEYLKEREPEIIDFCEHFKARAYIHVNKLNHKDISLLMMERLAQRIRNKQINQKNLFDSIVGELHSVEKRWIIDWDNKDVDSLSGLRETLNQIKPNYVFDNQKIIAEIPTKNGWHLITKPFDTKAFKNWFPHVDIVKHNPTILYLPNSLE